MTFKQILLASCALVISATAANAQIPSYVPTNGLVGWWPFNGNANDESGNGYNGQVFSGTNGAIQYTEDRNGELSQAIEFSSNNAWNSLGPYITINNSQNLLATDSYTINYFIKVSSSNITGEILNKGADNSTGAFINRVNNGNMQCFVGGYSGGINNIAIQSNTWLMITITRNESGVISLKVNGMEMQQFINSPMVSGSSQLSIGAMVSGGSNGSYYPFQGALDDIAIYNRALTEQEIQNLYTGTTTTVDTGDGAAPLPQGIPYQAAARDAQGQSLVNASVNVRFTLHEGAADGAASYAETHALTTNGVGLFNTVFGSGTPEQSAFDSINWAATTKFLQVEIDLGEGYVDMGTTQLLSVPYALRSDEAARVKNAGLPVFNDNAAALAGGLVEGEMYRTSAGVLMVAY
jgi:hypothetical protein